MQYKLHTLLALSLFTFATISSRAQTIATFDDLTLPGANSDYATTLTPQDYEFQSGLVSFYGVREDWGGYGAFNYTNMVDTVTSSFTNDKAAITGSGYDGSANYGVAYAPSDWPLQPEQSVLIGAVLNGNASGSKVLGMYVTNTTYAYNYIKDTYHTGDWYKLVIRGYLNNVQQQDSIVYTLASYTATDTVLLKTWDWVSLISLGDVDSLSFQVVSTDDYTPFYFAIDDVTTLDGICPTPQNIAAVSINENSATINWDAGLTGVTTNYEVAVDMSPTLAPTATTTLASSNTYNAVGLNENTLYFVHVRASCDDGSFSEWDTATFKTLQSTGIFQSQHGSIQVSISPNPATDYLTLHAGIAVNAIVYSIEGKQLLMVNNAKSINISSLPAGVYVVKVMDKAGSGQQTTLRFTKQD